MPTISAVINTRNEEANIRYCLESVKWCDEIIVVDMESEDHTVAIAREYTDKIYTHEKVLAFDIARKFAAEKATGDWVLLIDADELVPQKVSLILKDIAVKDSTDIVYLPFKTYIMGTWIQHTGWWPDYHPRFFKKSKMEFVETVHAFMREAPDARKHHLPAVASNAIEHFAYLDSEHFITKLNRYTNIEAQHLLDAQTSFSLCRMFTHAVKEFILRFLVLRGYKDGYHGFFLSLMMSFYRILTYIKLWEKRQNIKSSRRADYENLKNNITSEYQQSRKVL